MSSNPFCDDRHAPPSGNESSLFSVCQRNNRWAYRIGYRRWYFVQPGADGSSSSIATIEGVSADEVWAVSRGERIEYDGWSRDRLDEIERRCRWFVERGMPPEAFATLQNRYGWANAVSAAA